MEYICPGCGKPFDLPDYFAKCLGGSSSKEVPPKLEFCSPPCAERHSRLVEDLRLRLRITYEEGVRTTYVFLPS